MAETALESCASQRQVVCAQGGAVAMNASAGQFRACKVAVGASPPAGYCQLHTWEMKEAHRWLMLAAE